VALDDQGNLRGWVAERHLASGGGTVADVVRRFDESVELGDSLRRGLSELVQHDAGWLPVLQGDRYIGVLTANAVYAALRRTVPGREAAASEGALTG
jgi:osmoprotectant transport system ATP-binding protein